MERRNLFAERERRPRRGIENMGVVVRLSDRVQEKAEDQVAPLSKPDLKNKAQREVMIPAVTNMREMGLSSIDIATTLRFVAEVLENLEARK
jgi:hypothetical protein